MSPDGRTAASRDYRIVKLWNIETLREVVTLRWTESPRTADSNWTLSFDPRGKFLIAAEFPEPRLSADVRLRVWKAPSYDQIDSSGPQRLVR